MRFDRSVAASVDIDATTAEVWQLLEVIERHIEWMSDAVSLTFTGDQTRGVGTGFVCETRVGPFRVADAMEIVSWTPGTEMGVVHGGAVTGSGTFQLEPIDLGRRCRLNWSETLSFPWWMGGPIGAALGGRVLQRIWRRNLRTFRHLVES